MELLFLMNWDIFGIKYFYKEFKKLKKPFMKKVQKEIKIDITETETLLESLNGLHLVHDDIFHSIASARGFKSEKKRVYYYNLLNKKKIELQEFILYVSKYRNQLLSFEDILTNNPIMAKNKEEKTMREVIADPNFKTEVIKNV